MCSRPGPRSSRTMKQRPSTISVVVAAVRPSSMRAAEDGVDEEEREQRGDPHRDPGREGECGQRLQQSPAIERALARCQREDEGRDPDRQQRRDSELARQEREGEVEDRREEDQEPGVDRLGQVQAAEAVDVARDPPALADRARQHRELVAQQDDVGDALGDLAAGAHRDREVGLLERGDVVDAVADHRRVAAALAERADRAASSDRG